jgi:hypothetical protein
MFYVKGGDVLLRDNPDGSDQLEIWSHARHGWIRSTYRLPDLDPTDYRDATDEEAEALTQDDGIEQPPPRLHESRRRAPLLVRP